MTTADTIATMPVMRHAHTGVIVAHGRDVFTKVANATLSSDVHASSPAAPSRAWVSKSISINGDAGDGGCDGAHVGGRRGRRGGGGGAGGGDGGGGDGPSTTFVAITGGTTLVARRKPAPRLTFLAASTKKSR